MSVKVEDLLSRPIWQLTGEEFVALHVYACSLDLEGKAKDANVTRITGVRALADCLACCESTVYMLLREGALDEAIISRIGKKIIFNGEKAQVLAQAFMESMRKSRKALSKSIELCSKRKR